MYINAIKYRDLWLAPGSVAYQLHRDGKLKELDDHIKAVLTKENTDVG